MRTSGWLSVVLALSLAACGSSHPTLTGTDAGNPVTDTPANNGDSATQTDSAAADVARSTAGNACTMDTDCDNPALMCDMTLAAGECTGTCTDNASQTVERTECGGTGSTCLTEGDGTDAESLCWRSCTPTALSAATGACPSGFVCTGWWYTHMTGMPDSTGCAPYCSADSQCPTGTHCNPRVLGSCLGTAPNTTAYADGQPCDPSVTVMVPGDPGGQPRNVQCQGLCFRVDNDTHNGICGSSINIKLSSGCPNANVSPEAPSGDNLALCVFQACTTNLDCTAPLVCNMEASGTICEYPVDADGGGIPGDAGPIPTDAASSDVPTATDATSPSDTGTATDVPTATDAGTATDAYDASATDAASPG